MLTHAREIICPGLAGPFLPGMLVCWASIGPNTPLHLNPIKLTGPRYEILVPESYRINEYGDARPRRQSRSPGAGRMDAGRPFLNGSLLTYMNRLSDKREDH